MSVSTRSRDPAASSRFNLSPIIVDYATNHSPTTTSQTPLSTAIMSFQMLDQREEDELHKTRLLNVEEKPFKRITKRLLTPGSLVSTPSKLPTPPPDTAADASALEAAAQQILDERRQFREDVLLDFAAFDSSIARIQFLRNSNERERDRYVADKERILETAQAVRDSTAGLRVQLDVAKATLEQRKKFDKLAEKITLSKTLKSREEQAENLRKLEEECEGLEREKEAHKETWQERREQFGRIVEEGLQLRRLIRDEKEEGMDIGEEDGEVGEGATPKESSYGGATPRPEEGLKPRSYAQGRVSRASSRAPSPARSARRGEEDAAMADSGAKGDTPMAEAVETPQISIDEPAEDGAVEEDKMDTT